MIFVRRLRLSSAIRLSVELFGELLKRFAPPRYTHSRSQPDCSRGANTVEAALSRFQNPLASLLRLFAFCLLPFAFYNDRYI